MPCEIGFRLYALRVGVGLFRDHGFCSLGLKAFEFSREALIMRAQSPCRPSDCLAKEVISEVASRWRKLTAAGQWSAGFGTV